MRKAGSVITLSENIKNLRKRAVMTQEQLADKLGVTRQTVSKWKNNMSVPDADILSEMADVFDVSVSELLGYGADNGSTKDYAKILASLNGELAEKSRFRKSILRIIKAVLILLGVGFAALILYILFWMFIAAGM
ncbi:helix-turn-helix domain-containing protein [Hornefia butyriciproducens]|uniref:helix-turn-helix domain-containing protein n=1 Tax=Hornefia butyriciproducens TaxID=2652293 RepID=UPI002A90EDB5|nr:helix-turn-helix transcriptional regulator [Hornefia butyriciproducens]MDY5462087.1 helix-turn-helix transcriptional regulator [Hornefia butyriciproducens]